MKIKTSLSTIVMGFSLAVVSTSAMACPKGMTLVGGEGPKHKGGKCVLANGAPAAKTTAQAKKADKTEPKSAMTQSSNKKTAPVVDVPAKTTVSKTATTTTEQKSNPFNATPTATAQKTTTTTKKDGSSTTATTAKTTTP